jgi:hypothetical protein
VRIGVREGTEAVEFFLACSSQPGPYSDPLLVYSTTAPLPLAYILRPSTSQLASYTRHPGFDCSCLVQRCSPRTLSPLTYAQQLPPFASLHLDRFLKSPSMGDKLTCCIP